MMDSDDLDSNGEGVQHSTVLGRKIEKTIRALEDVEQFEQVDTDAQIKQFLSDTRDLLRQMIRVVNIRRENLTKMEVITDLSYGFELLNDYTQTIHERVRSEPSYSVLLKAGRNFCLKSRVIFLAEIIRLEMQFRPPDALPL